MNEKLVEEIASAVLYEGYMLYPYRPSSVKNRQRWNFGVVYPKAYSELQSGADNWVMHTECLATGSSSLRLRIKVRFLQAVAKTVGELKFPIEEWTTNSRNDREPDFHIVETLQGRRPELSKPGKRRSNAKSSFRLSVPARRIEPAAPSHSFFRRRGNWNQCARRTDRFSAVIVRTKEAVAVQIEVGGRAD